MIRKFALGLGLLAVLAGLGFGGHYWWQVARFQQSTDDAYVESDISAISPRIDGYIQEVPVVDNQAVRKGDVLAIIDDRDFRARVDQARASLATDEAAVATYDSQIAFQHSKIAQAQAQLDFAGAELERAKSTYDRRKKLVDGKIISVQEMDDASADFRKAKADVVQMRAALVAEQGQLAVIEAERRQAEAKVAQSQAELELAASELDKTVIRAPIDGVVGDRTLRPGQFVKQGQQLLALVPIDMHVVANFKETQLGHIRPGQKVEIHVDAFPGQPVIGTVESFSPASGAMFSLLPPQNATGNFTKIVQRVPVRIGLPRGSTLAGLLRPGLSVVVSVDTRGGEGKALVAASDSLLFGAAQASTDDRLATGESR
jgi:membrane fusion protein, multidrug efflux system